jgi:hypothetical protein
MKNKILKLLDDFGDGASFAEISRIEGFNGEFMYGFPEMNVYYWFSCSQEAIDALKELITEERIVLKPTVELVYLNDGIRPKYPIAKQTKKYISTRWLPVVINKGVNYSGASDKQAPLNRTSAKFRQMREPSQATIKRLFALSNNNCAFPGCILPIISETGTITGRICHIKAKSPLGPRYDSNQSDEDRNTASNLILLCAHHHDIIDKEPKKFTAEILYDMKITHEKSGRREVLPSDSIIAERLLNDYRKLFISNNQGNIAINSPGTMQANIINIKTHKKYIQVLPPIGTISDDLRMKGYVEHLIKRYNEFAAAEPYRKTKFSHGAIRRNIEHNFGVKWDFVPVERFEELVQYIQGRIDRTRQAKINKGKGYKSYSPFLEFCEKFMKTNS